MKDLRTLYKVSDDDPTQPSVLDAPDYEELIASMEYEVLWSQDFGRWQGDSIYILKDSDKYGMLVFGWGSCTVCDALEGCDTYEDFEALRNEFNDSIKWHDTMQSLIDSLMVKDPDRVYEWWYFDDEATAAIREAVVQLQAVPA